MDLTLLPPQEEMLAERRRRSFAAFIRGCWPVIEKDPLIDSWVVDALAEHFQALAERRITRLIVNIPPRMSKSTVASVMFPAWIWLREPGFRCVTNSYQEQLATRDSLRTRRLLDTDWYHALNRRADGSAIFRMRSGADKALKRLKDGEQLFENDRGGFRLALGVEGAFTGKGGNGIGVDDPQDPKRSMSEAERIQTLSWWDQTVPTRLDNPVTGLKWIIMQRLHAFDLTGHVIAQNLNYVHLRIPMRFKPSSRCVTVLGPGRLWADPRQTEGELLQPERFTEGALKEIETPLGPYGVAGQMQQEPMPDGGGLFRLSWFRRWTHLPLFDLVAISVDAAFGDAVTSSYVVLQIWGFKGPDAYLLDQVRRQMDFTTTLEAFKDLYAKYQAMNLTPSAIVIERKANGAALISSLSKHYAGIVKDKDDKRGINPRESKEARAAAVTPMVAAGNVYLPEDGPDWINDFLIEVVNFPRYAHDDQVDAMTQALSWRYLNQAQSDADDRRKRFRIWARVRQGGRPAGGRA